MQDSLAREPWISLRCATENDLEAINRVISAAIQTWDLPERVKRLATPSYHYKALDLQDMEIMLAETGEDGILGVVAWETAQAHDLPPGKCGLLLHGIFVHPRLHRQGIGSHLFAAVEAVASERELDGLLVKAQADAIGFFLSQGLEKLTPLDPQRDFENRFWKQTSV